MVFKDLSEFVAEGGLELPVDGKVYTIPEADAQTFVWAQRQVQILEASSRGEQVDGAQLDDEEEGDFFVRLLGEDAYEQMLADNISSAKLKRVAATVLIWIVADEETAQTVWESGDSPEAVAAALEAKQPNRAARRASAAAARTTKPRASTTGTRASKSTPSKPAGSRGRRSSSSGG